MKVTDFNESLEQGNFLNRDHDQWAENGEIGVEPVEGEGHLRVLKEKWDRANIERARQQEAEEEVTSPKMETLLDLAIHYSKFDVIGLSRAVSAPHFQTILA